MKKNFLFLIIFGAFSLLTLSGAFAVIPVMYEVDENYPPLTFKQNESLYGFDIDLTNLIFNTSEYTVNTSAAPFSDVYEKVTQGDIDLAGLIALTDGRKNEVLYSDPVFVSYISLYTKADGPQVDLKDLSALKIGVGKSYYTQDLLKNQLNHQEYIVYDRMETALDDLKSGVIDAIFENEHFMEYLLIKKEYKGEIVPRIAKLFPFEFAYAVSKSRPELVKTINSRLKELKVSGVFEELYTKYFYTHSPDYSERQNLLTFRWVLICLIAIAVIASALRVYIIFLRSKVQKSYLQLLKTHEQLRRAQTTLRAQYDDILDKQCLLEKSQERYQLIMEGSNDGLWEWQQENHSLHLPEKWQVLLGCPPGEAVNCYREFMQCLDLEDVQRARENLNKYWREPVDSFQDEYRMHLTDGRTIWVLAKGKILRNVAGRVVRAAGSITDISDRKEHEASIYRMAYYDQKTGLPNRSYLSEKLEEFLKEALQEGRKAALYFIDLDNFKQMNETLGHDFGDLVLSYVGKSLTDTMGENVLVAKVGGDEYCILQYDVQSMEKVIDVADRIMRLFSKNLFIGGHEIFLSFSMGVIRLPDDAGDIRKVFSSLDTAMYAAKEAGRNTYRIFHESMLQKVQSRTEMENNLRKAIENQEFVLHFQPFYGKDGRSIVGLEALIRWNDPQRGLIYPSAFIPVAEETGLISQIGRWVFEETCRQMKAWQEMGLRRTPVAVNVSQSQLRDPGFLNHIFGVLDQAGLSPDLMEIEITESSVMESLEENARILTKLRDAGIKISLDDFGTGYSSLSCIQKLPLDTVKIDKSFVDEIARREDDHIILCDIISIAHKLHMTVVAEGIESEKQRDYLVKMDCDKMQGYLFCRPRPASEIKALLEKQPFLS